MYITVIIIWCVMKKNCNYNHFFLHFVFFIASMWTKMRELKVIHQTDSGVAEIGSVSVCLWGRGDFRHDGNVSVSLVAVTLSEITQHFPMQC